MRRFTRVYFTLTEMMATPLSDHAMTVDLLCPLVDPFTSGPRPLSAVQVAESLVSGLFRAKFELCTIHRKIEIQAEHAGQSIGGAPGGKMIHTHMTRQ